MNEEQEKRAHELADCKWAELAAVIEILVSDKGKLRRMEVACKTFYKYGYETGFGSGKNNLEIEKWEKPYGTA